MTDDDNTAYKVTLEMVFDEASGARSALQKGENALKNAEQAAADGSGEITSIRKTVSRDD